MFRADVLQHISVPMHLLWQPDGLLTLLARLHQLPDLWPELRVHYLLLLLRCLIRLPTTPRNVILTITKHRREFATPPTQVKTVYINTQPRDLNVPASRFQAQA